MKYSYFDRDISWLSFNERVLLEAADSTVPLLERINFLSIYSSNLDEFYRVRIPSLMALQKIRKEKNREYAALILGEATLRIQAQQEMFGQLLTKEIIPALRAKNVWLIYNEPIPEETIYAARDYFFTQVLAYIQPFEVGEGNHFFPENNTIYLAVQTKEGNKEQTFIVNIPSAQLPRFFSTQVNSTRYVVFIDDLIKHHLPQVFPGKEIIGAWSFKVTRDAELDLQDEYEGDIAEKIEKQIAKRDLGFATRFLHCPGIPTRVMQELIDAFHLRNASMMEGGNYHHLRDLASFPYSDSTLSYPKWPAAARKISDPSSLLASIDKKDIIVHTPYQDYSLVLRFFNEASIDPLVSEIYVTMYRIAGDSRIAAALISAARNGKQVTVFVELKARFDEANNIKWSKRMKEAGVRIIYSIPGLKVHAKVALVKRPMDDRSHYYGLLATGNFNESTARFYTDHILMTANKDLLRELELLFIFLAKRKKPEAPDEINFRHLLVAQFNLRTRFVSLIDREIAHAREGKKAKLIIKLNNLEEKGMIDKLYEAAAAGVEIRLLVRTICRLIPGASGQHENLQLTRIVDRYLEHGRLFWFYNNGDDELYAGSADWMDRNIHRRIEVCFPILDPDIKKQLLDIADIQLRDNVKAVTIDTQLKNLPIASSVEPLRSQEAIWKMIQHYE